MDLTFHACSKLHFETYKMLIRLNSIRNTKNYKTTACGIQKIAKPTGNRYVSADKEARESEKIVESHYIIGHTPLGVKVINDRHVMHYLQSKYGAPFTNTTVLESWPNSIYKTVRKPKTIGDKTAYGLVEFFKLLTHVFFRNK